MKYYVIKYKHKLFKIVKLFTVLAAVTLIIFSMIIPCFAAENLSFNLNGCETDKNRLFTVEMTAKCEKTLSAASFEFSYDKSMFEFRSAKADDNDERLAVNELQNKIKAVYLNTDGKNIKNESVVFTLTFKAVKSGEGYIDFNVSDCVSGDIKPLSIGNCTSGKITVNTKSADNKTDKSKPSKSREDKNKSIRNTEQITSSAVTIDELGTLNSFDNQNHRFLIIGIVFGTAAVVTILIIYNIIKHFSKKRIKRKDSSEK